MKLNNGIEIPSMGFGTYKMAPEDTKASVLCALRSGWRHIDTAAFYRNEAEGLWKGIGSTVRKGILPSMSGDKLRAMQAMMKLRC